ncbi:MAG: M20/M25/M40 family metallo-hydrolase [Verrucomicrobiales bacterium]|nr:M20/M25/M40 family metallo-hydrolase [Verrucomicrobiales bacterium]
MTNRIFRVVLGVVVLLMGREIVPAAEHPSEAPADIVVTLQPHQIVAARILTAAQEGDQAHRRLAELCDTFGPRITGSTNLESAIDWILNQLRLDGFSRVRGEPVTVPNWVRGAESLELRLPRRQSLRILGVGGTSPTPEAGIEAEVLVVTDFAELKRRSAEAVGRIVLFDLPFTDYGSTVAIRTRGAMEAAQAGAVASLIRSVGPFSMQTPHTGIMQKTVGERSIPHAAITLEDAAMFRRMQDRGQRIVVHLKLASATLPDAISRNVVAEYLGREFPDEVVVVGGHIDSWDVGQGAVDDGGGCIAAWEAIRLVKRLGLQPRRTLRLVLWTGEENGLWGAKAYRKAHERELANHVLAIESDRGVFAPEGFAFTGSGKALPWIQEIAKPLRTLRAERITLGNGGMDVMELIQGGVPVMDLVVDRTRYFWYHHSEADTVDKVDPRELNLCIGTLAVMAHGVADMPLRLPR